jgi:hypothetical protein
LSVSTAYLPGQTFLSGPSHDCKTPPVPTSLCLVLPTRLSATGPRDYHTLQPLILSSHQPFLLLVLPGGLSASCVLLLGASLTPHSIRTLHTYDYCIHFCLLSPSHPPQTPRPKPTSSLRARHRRLSGHLSPAGPYATTTPALRPPPLPAPTPESQSWCPAVLCPQPTPSLPSFLFNFPPSVCQTKLASQGRRPTRSSTFDLPSRLWLLFPPLPRPVASFPHISLRISPGPQRCNA